MKKTIALTLMATSFVVFQAMASEQQEDPRTPIRLRQAFDSRPLEGTPKYKQAEAEYGIHGSPYGQKQFAKAKALEDRARRLAAAHSEVNAERLQADLDAEEERFIRVREEEQVNQLRNAALLREVEEARVAIGRVLLEKGGLERELQESQDQAETFRLAKEELEERIRESQEAHESV